MNFLQVRLGLERGNESRTLAWALDFPGAFAYGKDDAEALEKMPEALANYKTWQWHHDGEKWENAARIELQVVETFDTFITADGNTIYAFFEDDRRPLQTIEIVQALKMHTWQRQELLEGVRSLSSEIMTRMLPGQRWNINGILNHIGRTEIYCLESMELPIHSAEFSLVHNPFRILELSFELIQNLLPKLEGDAAVRDQGGELWSARKLLRRLLWHQRDHIDHIQQILEIANW